MKLGGVVDGSIYGTEFRSVVVESSAGQFERVGSLPVPTGGPAGLRYRLRTGRRLKPLLQGIVGRFATVNLWPVSDRVLVATADRWLFVSEDGGRSWTRRLELPPSSGPMGVLPTGFCAHDGTWFLGEYPLATDVTPTVRRSRDRGRSWETVCSLPSVRHVHAVQADPYTGTIWLTTGDVGEGCSIGRLREGGYDRIGAGDQSWRAVALAFTPTAVLWGMDSVYERENPLYRLPRSEIGAPDPRVETVARLESSVYYAATVETADDHWTVFSTAVEPGTDSTAPAGKRVSHSGQARVVAARDSDQHSDWIELAGFGKRSVPADRRPLRSLLPSANAYVFLSADPDRGLLINPYNTATQDGAVVQFPPAYFSALERDTRVDPQVAYPATR